MRHIIRVGDRTTHNGVVLTGASSAIFMGRAVARLGDKVSCPQHGENHIVEGASHMTIEGQPVALEGHKCQCGCTLISSLQNVTIE